MTFERPELVSISMKDRQRSFPICAAETRGSKTVLHCARTPGFVYDSKSLQLKDTGSPLHVLQGKGQIPLPVRTWIRGTVGEPNVLEVRALQRFAGRSWLICDSAVSSARARRI